MRHRHARQPNRLHPPKRIRQRVQLHLHLARLRRMEPAPFKPPSDIPLHQKRQLQWKSQSSVV